MWVRIRSHLWCWCQCKTLVWFFTPTWKWICKSQRPVQTPTIISTTLEESENFWARKTRARLYMHLSSSQMQIIFFITSQIDYCSNLMTGLPDNLIKNRQHVQNTAARPVFSLSKYDPLTPPLVMLHWVPVKYQTEFKTFGSSSKDIMARQLVTSKKWHIFSLNFWMSLLFHFN